ncbi:FIG00675867: hypothetical protein [hydrothermal vent metagenome]|uniref:DUF3373 domain-containing protein n=1 Tax=hydrothermal vent metagenome TaxID=652676 RepID=A0A3B0W7H4_9ZZZZ
MVKRFSTLVLAGLIALPAAGLIAFPGVAAASAGKAPADLTQKINELSRELDELKAQLAQQSEAVTAVGNHVDDLDDTLTDKSKSWDLAARFKLFGDFRASLDYMHSRTMAAYTANQITQGFKMALAAPVAQGGFGAPGPYSPAMIRMAVQGMKNYTPQQRAGLFQQMGITPVPAYDVDNDTMLTNRLRINMMVRATETVTFKGRLAMYKAWGMESNPTGDMGQPFTLDGFNWDGNSTRQPVDNVLRVDRAFINWAGINGTPFWISVGRRPTTDGPPSSLRLGLNERQATPTAFMDYAFDGATIGYAYDWGNDLGTGRIRFCYGRGFEAGLSTNKLNDMDFAGFNWDVFKKGHRFLNLQLFKAFNLVNTPDGINFPNPLELAGVMTGDGVLNKANLGNIYHTSGVYMDKVGNLNYFVAGAWSHTVPTGYDELGDSLLGSWWAPLDEEDGYSVYLGVRYDMDDLGLKFGAEYNYGSKYWISMSPADDELYNSKLATRGQVWEAYMVYDLPTGEAISKYSKVLMRLGYLYYKYDYTYSGSWLGAPVKVDDLASDPLNAQFYAPLDDMSQVYLTLEAYF